MTKDSTMYSTQPFLRGFQRGRGQGATASDAAGARRLKLLSELSRSQQGMTAFELAVKADDRPDTVISNLRVLSNVNLVEIDGDGEDAFVQLTDTGRKYLDKI